MSLRGPRIALLVAGLTVSSCGLFGRTREAEAPPRIDLNAAPIRKIETLPGITPTMARRIVDGRPYRRLDDLVARDILTERELDRIRDRIIVPDQR